MPTHAGEMTTTPPADPQWKACNGGVYYILDWTQSYRTPIAGDSTSRGNRLDYRRRVGWYGRRMGLGPLGWRVAVPYDKTGTWYVTLADDNTEATLTNPPTVATPPAGVT